MADRDTLKSKNKIGGIISDKERKVPCHSLEKGILSSNKLIDLPEVDNKLICNKSVFDCIKERQTRRKYKEEYISLEELSYLLWATQGIVRKTETRTYRNVPSACGRHPFESYIIANRISGLEKGLYRYVATQHKLVHLYSDVDIDKRVNECTNGQTFVGAASAVFVWSCIPYRSEWELGITAHKAILLDAGHICQNLYIACESLKLGVCAIADYNQERIDELLGIDGIEELTVYLASVGCY